MNHGGHNPPDIQLHLGGHFDWGKMDVLRHEIQPPALLDDPLYRQLSVNCGNDDPVIIRLQGPVHNKDVPGMNTGIDHGIPRDPDKKRRRGIPHQKLVEVQLPVNIIIRGEGKPAGIATRKRGSSTIVCFSNPYIASTVTP